MPNDTPATKPEQAKPAPQQAVAIDFAKERRDRFAQAFGAAILSRGGVAGRKADSLAREVIAFTDAFLAEIDKPRAV